MIQVGEREILVGGLPNQFRRDKGIVEVHSGPDYIVGRQDRRRQHVADGQISIRFPGFFQDLSPEQLRLKLVRFWGGIGMEIDNLGVVPVGVLDPESGLTKVLFSGDGIKVRDIRSLGLVMPGKTLNGSGLGIRLNVERVGAHGTHGMAVARLTGRAHPQDYWTLRRLLAR